MTTFPEVRCTCGKLFFLGETKRLEIKCDRCKRFWLITGTEKVEVFRNGQHSTFAVASP